MLGQADAAEDDTRPTSGGDALWWAIAAITMVGYGGQYPVTALGRVLAAFVMFAGVGIIGALAGILASFLISTPEKQVDPTMEISRLRAKLAAVREELAAIRELLTIDKREPKAEIGRQA